MQVNTTNRVTSSNHEYGPFGELIRASGPMAKLNPFRFSAKYDDDETDFLYYGYRYYNPSTGRWISRDTLGEDAGSNLYGFVENDPIGSFDLLGESGLEYWSEGKVQYDGPGEYTLGITWQVDRSYSQSGVQQSPNAYFWQTVYENKGCDGGTCNSGGTAESSSSVTARVTNTGPCTLTVTCQCKLEWYDSDFTPSKKGRKGFIVAGAVLGHSFSKTYLPKRQPNGSYLAAGGDSFSQQKTFTLAVGASRDLYHGYDQITSPPNTPGAGWLESMSGSCSCSAK
jgi:RHS repeat-associated protein